MSWIILGISTLIVLFVIVSYNSLVRGRMQTKEAWSQIDVQLKRRNDLLPNLIETVKGYAKYENSCLGQSLLRVHGRNEPLLNQAPQPEAEGS